MMTYGFFHWLALIGAALLRIVLSPWEGATRSIISFSAALFCGYVLPDPLLSWLHGPSSPDDGLRTLMIILCALTGEGVVRFILNSVRTPKNVLEVLTRIILAFRGKS